jgi:hypothetical protein
LTLSAYRPLLAAAMAKAAEIRVPLNIAVMGMILQDA